MPSLIQQFNQSPKPDADKPVSDNAAPAPTQSAAQAPVQMRAFGDTDALRKSIYDNAFKAAQAIEPVSNARYSLHLTDPHWVDPEKLPLSHDKQAILTGGSLMRRMRGTWHLKDPQGTTVAKKTATIAHIPYLTNRGTFIMGGSEYTLGHQMRLRPGVFTRIKENGELEAHINIMPGKGLSHRYFLEPETGIFKVHIGQASLPLYPVLSALGATDEELRKSWGPELFAANKQKDDPRTLDKLYERLVGRRGPANASIEDKRKLLATAITNMELDPEVTKRTLGQPHAKLTKDAALATANKLLAISRGQADTDDRDHLAYQHFLGPEDLIAERIGRDKGLLRELLWKATTKGSLDTLPTGAFTKSVHDAVLGSGLGMSLEEINLLDVLDQQTRVSRLGYGGIPCASEDTYVLTKRGWVVWKDVKDDDQFAVMLDGRICFRSAIRIIRQHYDGIMVRSNARGASFCMTPDHRMYVSRPWNTEKYEFVTADKVATGDYVFPVASLPETDKQIFVTGTVAIGPAPIKNNNRGKAIAEDKIFQLADWLVLFGYYLADGSYTYNDDASEYRVEIAKRKSKNPYEWAKIENILHKLDLEHYYSQDKAFRISGKHLAYYFSQFGKAADKYIPEEWFEDINKAAVVVDSLLDMDGRWVGDSFVYETMSEKLALQVSSVVMRLGYTCLIRRTKRDKSYVVTINFDIRTRGILRAQSLRRNKNPYNLERYSGTVYCAEVPGGLLLTMYDGCPIWSGNSIDAVPDEARSVQPSHLGFIDLLRTPESFRAGVDSRVSYAALKGSDKRVYTPVINPRTGQTEYKSPQDVSDSVIAFPNEFSRNKPMVWGMVNGKVRYLPRDKVDYILPHMEQAFSPINNLVPMKSAVKGQRAAMASRFITQALPLDKAQAPLVRGQVPGRPGLSFEEHYGKYAGAVHANNKSGRVLSVADNEVKVRYEDGTVESHELYHNHPHNRKTFAHNTPVVQVGDPVRPNQLLARSNYTDENGHVALGKNLRVAYIPFKGTNYEDAYVISASAAKELASEHMYQHNLDWDDMHRKGKKSFISIFPARFEKKAMDNIDDEGAVKPGTIVNPGDPLIVAARERELSKKQIHTAHKGSFIDDAVTWEHHSPGIVTDVAKTDKGVTVAVKSLNPTQVGDKISGRHGDKGIVGAIIPDEEMPHDAQGRPFHVLANPLGIVSRTNPAQIIEASLGKVAEKTGKPYVIDDFGEIHDLSEYAQQELNRHGMKGAEDIVDPTTGRRIPGVMTGNRYFMKLHHTSECVTPDTEVLTRRGWVYFPKVELTDELATVENGKLIYEKPIELIRQRFSGQLCCFSGRYIDYALTDNHRLYGRYYHSKSREYVFKTAEEIHGKRFVIPQFGFESEDLLLTDSFELDARKFDWGDYAELVGWWASAGCTDVRGKNYGCVTICQSYTANTEKFKRIEALLNRLQLRWKYYKSRGNKIGFLIYDRTLAIHLHRYGTKAINKTLPRYILDGPIIARKRAFEALMLGDGSVSSTKTSDSARYTTISKQLADDVQELAIRIGLGAIIRKVPARIGKQYAPAVAADGSYFKREIKSLSQVYHVGISLRRKDAQLDGDRHPEYFSKKYYNGLVYCATMRTGLIYIRRNGKPMLSGNSKGQGRGLGSYTAEGMPAKGGTEGSKRMAMMDINALLAHGAIQTLRDAKLIRGQKNQEYWSNFMSGFRPPTPQVPMVYEKFINQLRGAGINVQRTGSQLHIMAMTDKDIDELAGDREIQNADTVDWKSGMSVIKGGLFDERLTGGHNGNRWSHIKLIEPMPNPVFEEPIRRLLGLTQKKFESVLAGQEPLHGRYGPEAIQAALASINVPQAIAQARADIQSGRRAARDEAIKKLGFLKGADKNGIHPKDWMLTKVPVLPPIFRPVSIMQGTGGRLVSDANYLYKEVFDANKNLEALKGKVDDLSNERLALYNTFKAVTGLGDPVQPKNQERKVKGMLQQIFGHSPKYSVVQQKLLGTTVDLVGRAVVIPNPDLNMDQIGLPEDRAWEVYTPFITRRLVRRGVPRLQALQYVKDKHALAKQALLEEIDERPVIMTRAPVLHRYGEMAFYPRLTKGDSLQVSPIIVGGFGMDFDGDAVNYHVPASDEAAQELVERLLPSRNLLSAQRFNTHYLPRQEYLGGLHSATNKIDSNKRTRTFATRHEALQAYYRGEMDPDQPVHILDEKQ